MKIKSFLPLLCGVSLWVALPVQAQKMDSFLRAVGGLSARRAHIQALTQAHVAADLPGNAFRAHIQMPPVPVGTLLASSVSQAATSFARVPSRVTTFTLPQFPQLTLKAVCIPEDTYVTTAHILLPKDSYVIEMPDGDYHISTPQYPFTFAVIQQLSAPPAPVLLQVPKQTPKKAPKNTPVTPTQTQVGWIGKQEYLDPQELAQDVVRLNQPFTRYEKTPLGSVRVYQVPDNVVYLTTLGTKVTLQAQGPYAVMYQETTKTARFINKMMYPFLLATP